MKKIILFLLPFFVLALRSTSLAYTAPDGNDYQNYYHVTAVAGTFDIYCDNYLVASQEAMESTVYKLLYPFASENNSAYGLYQISSVYQNYKPGYNYEYGQNRDGQVLYNICLSQNGSTPQINSYLYVTAENLAAAGITIYSTNLDALQNSISNNIDFDSPYYDPLLQVPEVEIKYNTADYSSGNVPIMPISIALTNADSGYYVQAVMVNYMPSTVAVKYQDYDALMSHKFEQHNIIPAEMLKISSDLAADDLGELAVNAWSQDVVSYPVSNVVFTNQIGTDSGASATYQNMIDQYTSARRIGLFYGNNTELYFRYFYIDDSNKFVVSAWRTWSSAYSNTFGLAMPSYYKTYSSASGYENTDNNTSIVISPTSQPNVVNPSNNYGKKTGSPININIGSNVPNYPDYPTIATYNTDNLLVNALDTAKQLPDFFTSSIAIFNGMFNGILPDPFWGIIMTGFLFSIVIMIIKVL